MDEADVARLEAKLDRVLAFQDNLMGALLAFMSGGKVKLATYVARKLPELKG